MAAKGDANEGKKKQKREWLRHNSGREAGWSVRRYTGNGKTAVPDRVEGR